MDGITISVIEYVPAGIAVVGAAATVFLVVRGYLHSHHHVEAVYKHLASEVAARVREEERHRETLEQLRQNNTQLERMADVLKDINTTIGEIREIRHIVDRLYDRRHG